MLKVGDKVAVVPDMRRLWWSLTSVTGEDKVPYEVIEVELVPDGVSGVVGHRQKVAIKSANGIMHYRVSGRFFDLDDRVELVSCPTKSQGMTQ